MSNPSQITLNDDELMLKLSCGLTIEHKPEMQDPVL